MSDDLSASRMKGTPYASWEQWQKNTLLEDERKEKLLGTWLAAQQTTPDSPLEEALLLRIWLAAQQTTPDSPVTPILEEEAFRAESIQNQLMHTTRPEDEPGPLFALFSRIFTPEPRRLSNTLH